MSSFHLLLLIILSLGISWYLIVNNDQLKTWAERGAFGDMFGAVNTLFSGLAFAGLILAIYLQTRELSLQRQEIEENREELRGQREQLEIQNKTIIVSSSTRGMTAICPLLGFERYFKQATKYCTHYYTAFLPEL